MSENSVVLNTLYDYVKMEKATAPVIKADVYSKKLAEIEAWMPTTEQQYFMLLNNERRDYTLFNCKDKKYFFATQELREVLLRCGIVLAIDYNDEENYFEIWVKNNKEAFMYLLFPCDDFVIEA